MIIKYIIAKEGWTEENMNIIWQGQKGKSFEDLVYKLLQCMFPSMNFKQTDYVHDGGKDFYSIGNMNEETVWIEAKNYSNHLELSKFSNTFIMADISEINRIIIFSMSEITTGAKTNIARYAAYHQKRISVYAGNDVLFLIKKFHKEIDIKSYIQNAEKFLAEIKLEAALLQPMTIVYEYFHARQFNLTYRRDKENYIKQRELISLPLHSLVAQEIHITNNDLFEEKQLTLDYSEYKNNSFEVYFHETNTDSIVIPPSSTSIIVVFFKLAEICEKVTIPTIKFGDIPVKSDSNPCQTECYWLAEVPYMGSGWVKLQDVIHLLNSDVSPKIISVEGKSGVGKSRFLMELSSFFYRQGYRIISIDFRSITNFSLKNVLQIILNNIYVLDGNDDDIICFEKFGKEYKDFYDILFNESYDCTEHTDKICILLLSLFRKKQIVLLIDNIQDIVSETVFFFKRLLQMINNQPYFRSAIILCFNLDFLFPQKASYKLHLFIKQLASVYPIALSDFTHEDAKIYMFECLDPRRMRLDLDNYYDQVINRFGTNPFVLRQIMLYFRQRNIISFTDSVVYISNYADMKSVLSELPTDVNQLLWYRYQYLLQNSELKDHRSMNRIIWSILFFGKLKRNMINYLSLDIHNINLLVNYGFTEYNENTEIVFCHQLIEKSFCLFFLGNQYVKKPALTFIDDNEFIDNLFHVTNRIGKINLCIENMILRTYLNKIDEENFNLALTQLTKISPRQIMIPIIIETLANALNCGVKVSPSLEFKALYSISEACQERFDVHTAAEYTKDLVVFEQHTYKEKISAATEMLDYFKNYVYQLPLTEKYTFLDWLLEEANNFGLSNDKLQGFLGWLHNRYSKNLCSEHKFLLAKIHISQALNIALNQHDLYSAAQAEIEYGNIFAYNSASETANHWQQCVDYIIKCKAKSIYFIVFRYGYSVLTQILKKNLLENSLSDIEKLLELREKTFLYQKLFIDDVYADYYIVQYLDGECSFQAFKEILPKLQQMKSESYMHTPKFSILATYKLFTVYRLIYDKEPTDSTVDIILSLALELIKNNIFDDRKLDYSEMILYEIYTFCKNNDELILKIYHELPSGARSVFNQMDSIEYKEKFQYAITPLTNKNSQVNLLFFNYYF